MIHQILGGMCSHFRDAKDTMFFLWKYSTYLVVCILLESTLVIVSSDHGGIGYGHGSMSLDEIEMPFNLHGKGIKKNHEIGHIGLSPI